MPTIAKYKDKLHKDVVGFSEELTKIYPDAVFTSGLREGAVTKFGKPSRHATGQAIDLRIDPELASFLNSKEGVALLYKYQLGFLDESTPEGSAYGNSLHIGRDSPLVERTNNLYKQMFQQEPVTTDVNNLQFNQAMPTFAGVPDTTVAEKEEKVDKDTEEVKKQTAEYNFLQEIQNAPQREFQEQTTQQSTQQLPRTDYLQKYEEISQFIDTPFLAQQGVQKKPLNQATRADSLAVFNNTKAIDDYYKKQGYVKERVKDSKEYKKSEKFLKTIVSENQKSLKKAENQPLIPGIITQLDKNKSIAYEKESAKTWQKRLSETKDKVNPNKYLQELNKAKKSFQKRNNNTSVHVNEQGNLIEEKPSLEEYYKLIDENKFYQREQSSGFLDLRSPMPLYDKRITPQDLSQYRSPSLVKKDELHELFQKTTNKKEKESILKEIHNIKDTDNVEMYEYDPLAVIPFDMIPPENQEERVRKYGMNGVPKSIIEANPNWLSNKNNSVQPIQEKPKAQTLNIQPINQSLNIPTQEIDTRERAIMPKSFNIDYSAQRMNNGTGYYDNVNNQEVDINTVMRAKEQAERQNQFFQNKYGNSTNPNAIERLRMLKDEVEVIPNYQMGGKIYAQEGKNNKDYVYYGTSEYEKAYNEGRLADFTNILDEVTVTPHDKKYPFYQKLTPNEQKWFNEHLNSNDPISRQLRARAEDGKGFNADKAKDFVKGWMMDLPLASLQAPQSAMVEGIEAVRGNKYNMLNAIEPGKQRVPSETLGFDTTDKSWYHPKSVANFALDTFTDPSIITAPGVALKKPIQKGINTVLKNVDNIPTSISPELRQGLQSQGFFDMFKKSKSAVNLETPTINNLNTTLVNTSKNLEDLTYAKNWAKQYGYDLPENLKRIAQSDELTNRTIRGMMNRHNTFVRGVSTNWDELAKRNPDILKNLEERNINWKDNPEEAAKLMLTEIPPDTGYGRYMMNKGENALYTSNSIPTAQGYTYGDGYYAKLRRKNLDYSSNSRQDWINNNQLAYQKGINNPEGANIIKTDWQKRFPTNIEEFVKSAGNPNLLDDLMNKVDLKVKNKKSIIDKEWDKHVEVRKNIYNKAEEEMKKIYPDKTFHHADYFDIRDSFITNADKKALDFTSKKIDKFRAFDPIKYEENQTIKEIFTTPEFYKSAFRNLIKPDKFGHYAFKGNPGEQIFDIVDLKKMTPELWQNKSRAHIGKYSKKLSALSTLPIAGASYLATQTENKQQGGQYTENELAFLSEIAIKDNEGYRNPANKNKVVEINSPSISMKGIKQPIIAISKQTGEKKKLNPEQEFTFKNTKQVIEIPLFKK